MTDVLLTHKRDSEFYARLPRSEAVSLTDLHAKTSQAQVCRTCTHEGNRSWTTTRTEQAAHLAAGGSPEELFCFPTKEWGSFRLLNQIDWRNRIVPLDAETSIPTRAIVDTCGQQLRNDCARCDRFEPITVRVAYTTSRNEGAKVAFRTVLRGTKYITEPYVTDGSPVKYWNVTIGGHCGIPEKGMVIDGELTHCDWQPRKKRVESPSCANCYYADFRGEFWQFHHLEVNENAWLSPWEAEQTPPEEFGLALWRKQTFGKFDSDEPVGRRYWYEAVKLDEAMNNGSKIYKIRFMQSNAVAIIASDDDRFIVHELSGDKLAVDILYPHNKMFRLAMPTKKRVRIWPDLPKAQLVEKDLSRFIDPKCSFCSTRRACYYHAKGPMRDLVTREMYFSNPEGYAPHYEEPAHGMMHVIERAGEIVAVDVNDELPEPYSDTVANAAVFRKWLSALLTAAERKWGKAGRDAIMAQYHAVTGQLIYSTKMVNYRPMWIRSDSTEPNKTGCSHPDGPNLRKVFQDSFGSERVDWEFDHGEFNVGQVEEEWRVGYRQHSQTPQKLQEEILATDTVQRNYDPSSGALLSWPTVRNMSETVVHIRAVAGMHDDDGSPIEDTREFYERLDELVEVGEHGEVARKMTRRQHLFGYDLSRGFFGKRRGSEKSAMPAADPSYVIFGLENDDPDQEDAIDAWYCIECKQERDTLEVQGQYEPRCPVCDNILYKNHASSTNNPRAAGGIGNAYAMDTMRTQEQRRLYNTLCPHWRLKADAIITLDDVYGPEASAPAGAHAATKEEIVKIIRVGALTDEHKAANAAYNEELDAVMTAREEYYDAHPEVSPEELQERFPTPPGTIYQIKAAGSLSKMGGT